MGGFAVNVQDEVLLSVNCNSATDNQGGQHTAGSDTHWRGGGVVNAVDARFLLSAHVFLSGSEWWSLPKVTI